MARGTQLEDLVYMLRAEAGHSVLVSSGIDNLPAQKQILRRTQEMLYDDYDWPFMRVTPTKALAAGQRYYDLPTELNMERIESVVVWSNSQPYDITRGITMADYGQFSSDDDVRSDPVIKWDIRSTGDVTTNDTHLEQLEVWPIPVSNDQYLEFTGIRKLRALTSDDDVCDLDDLAIVLVCAAELLAAQKSAKAGAIQSKAAERIRQMKGRVKGAPSRWGFGSNMQQPSRSGPNIIRISGT